MSAKWTVGEVAQIVDQENGAAALEVLKYLVERGPLVIDWKDDRALCAECERSLALSVKISRCQRCVDDAASDAANAASVSVSP